ncbi:MAG: hypothetical protein EAZ24_08915 [Burkholderiales bacterium]|nr:MAG: hypothetical protein EAZ24_08915 [Burkholderiales bacterium]
MRGTAGAFASAQVDRAFCFRCGGITHLHTPPNKDNAHQSSSDNSNLQDDQEKADLEVGFFPNAGPCYGAQVIVAVV